jgi:hypothetical protein
LETSTKPSITLIPGTKENRSGGKDKSSVEGHHQNHQFRLCQEPKRIKSDYLGQAVYWGTLPKPSIKPIPGTKENRSGVKDKSSIGDIAKTINYAYTKN